MSFHCPKCQGVLYDRSRKTCGFCDAPLPEELRFSPAQLEMLRKDAEILKQREEQREADENARRDREFFDPDSPSGGRL